jgi:hypothetical protein
LFSLLAAGNPRTPSVESPAARTYLPELPLSTLRAERDRLVVVVEVGAPAGRRSFRGTLFQTM